MEKKTNEAPTCGNHCWIGIDPGKSGGIAAIDSNYEIQAHKMPETDHDVVELLRSLSPGVAVLEKVHSMPGQGVASTFKFGESFGGLKMALAACGIPFVLVTPNTWQRYLGCQSKGNKNVTKEKAQQLWPHMKITHAIADSMLLAKYCQEKWV